MALGMPTDNISSSDLESAVARFRAVGSVATPVEALLLPNWSDDDWKQLFRFTTTRRVPPGEALIRRGEPGRSLYFVGDSPLQTSTKRQLNWRSRQLAQFPALGQHTVVPPVTAVGRH